MNLDDVVELTNEYRGWAATVYLAHGWRVLWVGPSGYEDRRASGRTVVQHGVVYALGRDLVGVAGTAMREHVAVAREARDRAIREAQAQARHLPEAVADLVEAGEGAAS